MLILTENFKHTKVIKQIPAYKLFKSNTFSRPKVVNLFQ